MMNTLASSSMTLTTWTKPWHEILDQLNLCAELVFSDRLKPTGIVAALHVPKFSKKIWDEIKEKFLFAAFMAYQTSHEMREIEDVPECNNNVWRQIITIVDNCKERAKRIHKLLHRYYEAKFIIAGCEDSAKLLSDMVHLSFKLMCGLTLLSTHVIERAYMKPSTDNMGETSVCKY